MRIGVVVNQRNCSKSVKRNDELSSGTLLTRRGVGYSYLECENAYGGCKPSNHCPHFLNIMWVLLLIGGPEVHLSHSIPLLLLKLALTRDTTQYIKVRSILIKRKLIKGRMAYPCFEGKFCNISSSMLQL